MLYPTSTATDRNTIRQQDQSRRQHIHINYTYPNVHTLEILSSRYSIHLRFSPQDIPPLYRSSAVCSSLFPTIYASILMFPPNTSTQRKQKRLSSTIDFTFSNKRFGNLNSLLLLVRRPHRPDRQAFCSLVGSLNDPRLWHRGWLEFGNYRTLVFGGFCEERSSPDCDGGVQ